MARNSSATIRLVLLTCLLLLTGFALADASQADGAPWTAVSSGNAAMSGGGYALSGTLGQMAVGSSTGTGAQQLGAGFWYGVRTNNAAIYLPVVLR